jgi:ferredoxin-NADP reductase
VLTKLRKLAGSAIELGPHIEVIVHDVRQEATDVVSLTMVQAEGDRLPVWRAGAHLDVRLPSGLVRQYSLCGDPEETDSYRIAVLHDANGRGGSTEVHRLLRKATRLTISEPRNNFPLRPAPSYCFIAGGIGITPLLPMARMAARSGSPWRLIYGARSRDRFAFAGELDALPGGTVTYVPQEQDGLPDLEAIVASVPEGDGLYCCGPGALIDAVLDTAARHRSNVSVQFERFTADEVDISTDAPVFVELTRSRLRVTVPAGVSILDAVRAAGVEVYSSCGEGTCGTCETRVLAGIPDHRDVILTDEERAAGDTMMICVGRARSRHLVLDL